MRALFRKIAEGIPWLPLKLKQAGMKDTPEEFVKKTFLSAFYVTTAVGFFVWMMLSRLRVSVAPIIVFSLILFVFMVMYFLRVPDVKISVQRRLIDRELVFAGRFLIIELESGVPLYDALLNASRSFRTIGPAFKEIIDRIDLGTSVEDALNETIQRTPSRNMAKILWQILNVMKTGADISKSINSVIDQIVREQIIDVKQYGKKLNPLAMFYMVIAVILPSLGVVAIIVVASFMSITIDLAVLLTLVGLIAFLQFMFLSIIKSSRPAVEF